MKEKNIFFKRKKNIYLRDILNTINAENKLVSKNILINNIQNLDEAKKNDISFFHSSKYKNL